MRACKFDDCDDTDLATRSAMCRKHHREYTRQHYRDNKQYYVDKAARATAKIRALVRDRKNVPCADCGQRYHYCVMDFDHRENKIFNISTMAHAVSMKKLLEEIDKCDVVCSNCHRVRTFQRMQDQNLEALDL